MGAQQRKTLQSLLRITKGSHQLEEMRAAASTRLQLYQQEKDKEGVSIYEPIVRALEKARSMEEVESLQL